MMALDEAAFIREAARRLGDHLGAIRLLGRRWSYPLSAMIAHRYIDTRLALAGDAAHGVHPIAGQGLNLGFRDISDARRPDHRGAGARRRSRGAGPAARATRRSGGPTT